MAGEPQIPDAIDVDTGDGSAADESAAQTAQQGQIRLELDDSNVTACYANLCFVSSTAEEVLLDFALNQNPLGQQNRRIRLSQRVVLNYYTAKRLTNLLASVVQRYEQAFGVLETDVRKRLQPQSETA